MKPLRYALTFIAVDIGVWLWFGNRAPQSHLHQRVIQTALVRLPRTKMLGLNPGSGNVHGGVVYTISAYLCLSLPNHSQTPIPTAIKVRA